MGLRDEIGEQPDVVARLIGRSAEIEAIARAVRDRDIEHVVIAARGTSDHAAIYAQYLFGIRMRLLVALAAPSIVSLYHVEPVFSRSLVIGISQSGASPDVVGVVDAARRQGRPTIAITNEPGSPLATAAEHVIDLGAGPERAVAATKTYTAELTAIALLVAALGADATAKTDLATLPAAIEAAMSAEAAARDAAQAHAGMRTCTVLGRGFEYATAREWSLKLKELAHVVADPYSAADFRHGPLALVERGYPVLAVATSGAVAADLMDLLREIREDFGADLVVVSDREDVRALGQRSIAVPSGVPDHLAPIVSIVAGQLFAYHVTIARGLDPDAPRNISKVTLTT
ncbi:MAG TPA: SIS domain-containing protein [Candidatus Limnocylindrales bacterium]|jgi:glucosamine--fructose-6-phosphate aminotransferase (isomerizing)